MRHSPATSALTILGLLAGTVVVMGAAAWTLLNMSYGRALERELASLRADGYALTLAEVKPKPVPDAKNAATIYMPLFQVNLDPQHPTYNEPDVNKRGLNRFRVEKAEPAEALAARPILESPDARSALAKLRQASQMPFCVFPVRWDEGFAALFPHLSQMRQATRMVCAQALLNAHDGKTDEALDWIAVAYRMADQADNEPTLIAELVGVAMRAIAARAARQIIADTDLTAKQARPLYDQLGRTDLASGWDAAMRMELVMGLTAIEKMGHDPRTLAELVGADDVVFSPAALKFMTSGPGRPIIKLEEANYVRSMREALKRFAQPYRVTRGGEAYRSPRFGHILAGMLIPVFSRANAKRDQDLAATRLLQIVLALKAQKQSLGQYPDTLKGLVWQPPTEDPFSGKPLVYRRQGSGFLLYSVGPNLKDDGGKEPSKPGKISEEGDMVWRCGR